MNIWYICFSPINNAILYVYQVYCTYYNIIITLSGTDEARAAKRPRLDTEGMINARLVVLYINTR